MKPEHIGFYVSPESRKPLRLKSIEEEAEGEVVSGIIISDEGKEYQIKQGIPDLTYPSELSEQDQYARSFYNGRAEAYDKKGF
jgi:uncharacterized protein YbaR (Trm112 family)